MGGNRYLDPASARGVAELSVIGLTKGIKRGDSIAIFLKQRERFTHESCAYLSVPSFGNHTHGGDPCATHMVSVQVARHLPHSETGYDLPIQFGDVRSTVVSQKFVARIDGLAAPIHQRSNPGKSGTVFLPVPADDRRCHILQNTAPVQSQLPMSTVTLDRGSNQALGIGQFAIDFLAGKLGPGPNRGVLDRTALFHADAFLCGASALTLRTNAPTLLREEALRYSAADGATVFGSTSRVCAEKAVLANSSAVREWDSNGTNFGFNPQLGHTAGEFGHNDFYPVVVAACQERGLDGRTALQAMVLLDEIRGRLAEVFSLKSYKIDHVVHGAIASAAVYGALHGAAAEEIESAIGMFVAHYIPWRAIRAGKQLSDSKGSSAAISAEAAVLCMRRSMQGFQGPRDVFRNPEAIFRFFEPTTAGADRWAEQGDSPFDLVLSHSGDDFAVMGMHFKLGLYEHQSAGALQGAINLISENPGLLKPGRIRQIEIVAYEPAFGIIGNPMKKEPKTRQSADHSMAYIVATLIRKAIDAGSVPASENDHDQVWKELMLTPYDYEPSDRAIFHPVTRDLMQRIDFTHGGPEYDAKYPDGIPTSISITDSDGGRYDSGFVMYPAGHARNSTADLEDILDHKFRLLAGLAVQEAEVNQVIKGLQGLESMSAEDLLGIYDIGLVMRDDFRDG